jgi:anti-sigma factor (TIGR02949 family)
MNGDEEFEERLKPTERRFGAGTSRADCCFVIGEVWTFLDGGCCDRTSATVRWHLQSCVACRGQRELEARIKHSIAMKSSGEEAPV